MVRSIFAFVGFALVVLASGAAHAEVILVTPAIHTLGGETVECAATNFDKVSRNVLVQLYVADLVTGAPGVASVDDDTCSGQPLKSGYSCFVARVNTVAGHYFCRVATPNAHVHAALVVRGDTGVVTMIRAEKF